MIIQELVALLSLKVDTKALDQFQDKLGDLTTSLAGLGAPVAAAAGAIFGMTKMTADAGDEASKAAEKFGISAQSLQELQYAARGEAEILTRSMTFLSRSMKMAEDGSKLQADAFKQLGISYKDVNGKLKPTEAMIMEMSEAFSKMEDGPMKAALSMDILGKSGAELIPFFNQGTEEIARLRQEAIDVGFVLGEEAVENSMKFQDALDDMMNIMKGVRNTVGTGLIPIISKLMTKVGVFIKLNRMMIAQNLERFFETLSNIIETTWKFFGALYDSVSGVAQIFGGLENVVKAVAYAMALFAGAKVLFAIGQMAGAVMGLGHAFTLANAKALLIPILIGAAVVALGLIIEDIISFFQGKDSVTGVIVQKFQDLFAYLEEGFNGMGSGVKTFVAILMTPFRMLTMQIQNVVDLISVVRGKMSLKDFGGKALERLKGLNPFGEANESLKGALGFSNGSIPGATPSPSEISPGAANQTNNVNQSITVNAGSDASPVEIGREVGRAVNNPLDNILRGAGRSFSGAGGY